MNVEQLRDPTSHQQHPHLARYQFKSGATRAPLVTPWSTMRSEYPEHCKQKEIGNSLLQQCNNAKQANLHQNLGQISEQLALDWVKAILDKAQIGDETYYKQNTFKLS